MDETERRILELLRDLEVDSLADPEITSTAGLIHIRRDGEELATDISTGNALDSLLAYGWWPRRATATSHHQRRTTGHRRAALGRAELSLHRNEPQLEVGDGR